MISFTASASEVRIFSMNLHCALGEWQKRMDHILAEIVREDPDVIGFQEVCYNKKIDMASYITAGLEKGGYRVGSFFSYDTHQTFIHYQEQLLIISKHDATGRVSGQLPAVPFLGNGYVGLKIGDKWFLTTHLHFALPQVRENQYRALTKKFAMMKLVIFGDMNSNPSDGETSIFKNDNWVPFFDGPTFPSGNPTKTFDGFWTTGALHSEISGWKVRRHFVNDPAEPSDHLGISLRLITR